MSGNVKNMLAQIQRAKCRKNFWAYCQYVDSSFFTDTKPHLKLIASAFQEVAEGKLMKLAVSLPPRAGKSYITSMFCSWLLGRNYSDFLRGKDKARSIMRNSYAAKLAEKFSKDIRDGLIINRKVLDIFPELKLGKNTAVDGWSLDGVTQPNYFCAGVGGAITGFGCNLVAILDDPIKNIEEALSPTVIENTWNWYTSTHLSRLETGTPEIHIATRWSKKDPIGMITTEEFDSYLDDVRVICVPALNEKGESFCEEIKTTKEYMEIKKVTDEMIWEAEFMQQPVDVKGLLFPIEKLNRFSMKHIKNIEPDGIMGYTDVADKGKDFLSAPCGFQSGRKTYITDVVFTQEGVEISNPLVADMIVRNNMDQMIVEANNAGDYFKRDLRDAVASMGSKCVVNSETATQNKETRILLMSGYIKENFYFRDDYEPGSDYDKFMKNITSYVKFAKNTCDDGPDSITGLAKYVELIAPKPKKKKKKELPFALRTDTHEVEGVYMDW